MQISPFVRNAISTYSSGMLKKLSLVLAFIGEPKWILLDEPLITLDVNAVNIILSTIKYFHQNGISFLITSHQSLSLDENNIRILTIEHKNLQLLT